MKLCRCCAGFWLSLTAIADANSRSGRGQFTPRASDVARTASDSSQGSVLQIHATIYRDVLAASDLKYVISVDAIPESQEHGEPNTAMTENPSFWDEQPLALTWNRTSSADMKSGSLPTEAESRDLNGSRHWPAYAGTGVLSLFIPFESLSCSNDDMGDDSAKGNEIALYMIGLWRRRKITISESSASASLWLTTSTPRAISTERRFSEMECLARQVKRLPRTALAASLRDQDLHATVKLVVVDRHEANAQIDEDTGSQVGAENDMATAEYDSSKATPAGGGQDTTEKQAFSVKLILVLIILVVTILAVSYSFVTDPRTLRWALDAAPSKTDTQSGTYSSNIHQATAIEDITASLRKTTLRPPKIGPRILFSPRLVCRRAEIPKEEDRNDFELDEDSSLTDGENICRQDDNSEEDSVKETRPRDGEILLQGNRGQNHALADDSSVDTLSPPIMERRMIISTSLSFDAAIRKAAVTHVSAPKFVLAPHQEPPATRNGSIGHQIPSTLAQDFMKSQLVQEPSLKTKALQKAVKVDNLLYSEKNQPLSLKRHQKASSVKCIHQLKDKSDSQMVEGRCSEGALANNNRRRPNDLFFPLPSTKDGATSSHPATIIAKENEVHTQQLEHKPFEPHTPFQSLALPDIRSPLFQSTPYEITASEKASLVHLQVHCQNVHEKSSSQEALSAADPSKYDQNIESLPAVREGNLMSRSSHDANITPRCVPAVPNSNEVDEEQTLLDAAPILPGVTPGATISTSHQEVQLVSADTFKSKPSSTCTGDQSDHGTLHQRSSLLAKVVGSCENREDVNVYGPDIKKHKRNHDASAMLSQIFKPDFLSDLTSFQQHPEPNDSSEVSYVSTLPADSRSSKTSPMDNLHWEDSSKANGLSFHLESVRIESSHLRHQYDIEFEKGAEQPEKTPEVIADSLQVDIKTTGSSKSVASHLSASLASDGTTGDFLQGFATAHAETQDVRPGSVSGATAPEDLDSGGLDIDSPRRLSSFLKKSEGSTSIVPLPEYVPSIKLEAAARMFSKSVPHFASQKFLRSRHRGLQSNQFKSRRCPVNAKHHSDARSGGVARRTTTPAVVDAAKSRNVRVNSGPGALHAAGGRGDQKKRVVRPKQDPAAAASDVLRDYHAKSSPLRSKATGGGRRKTSECPSSGTPAEPHAKKPPTSP